MEQAVAQNIVNFIYSIDKLTRKNKTTIRKTIERCLKISKDDIDNLFIIKYHVEKECSDYMDEAIKFINVLIDTYSRGGTYDLDKLRSIDEIFNKDVGVREKISRLTRVLRVNSGVTFSGVNETWYSDNQLKVIIKKVVPENDTSIAYQLKTNKELDFFESEVFSRHSMYFSRERSNEIKESIELLRSHNQFEGKYNEIICIAAKRGDKYVVTLFDEEYSLKDEGERVLQVHEIEDKGMLYQVWIV